MIMIITLFVQLISNDIPAPAACTSRSLQHHFAIRADMHKLGLSPFGSTSTSYFSAAKKVNHPVYKPPCLLFSSPVLLRTQVSSIFVAIEDDNTHFTPVQRPTC